MHAKVSVILAVAKNNTVVKDIPVLYFFLVGFEEILSIAIFMLYFQLGKGGPNAFTSGKSELNETQQAR